MRSELYSRTETVGSDLRPLDLVLRPVAVIHDGRALFSIDDNGSSDRCCLVVDAGHHSLDLMLGFRSLPLGTTTSLAPLSQAGVASYQFQEEEVAIPVFRWGDIRFARICQGQGCQGSFSYVVVPHPVSLSSEDAGMLRDCGASVEDCQGEDTAAYIRVTPSSGTELVLQEFPDTTPIVTRHLSNGKPVTEVDAVPHYDHWVGELMERCGHAHIEEIGEHDTGSDSLPIREFLSKPTAWLEFAQLASLDGSSPSTVEDSLHAAALRRARLVSFVLATIHRQPPRRGRVIATREPRLVLLDQGGARDAIVRTEPNRWSRIPGGNVLVVGNPLRYLTTIIHHRSSYRMCSEAVDDFHSEEWRDRERYWLNDILFAGDRPSLQEGELATFVLETGSPEIVRTDVGSMKTNVTETKTDSIKVFITHVGEREYRLYVDGYRSAGGLTAVPIEQADPRWLIRGGRLRWRPKPLSPGQLRAELEQGHLPLVFRDRSQEMTVVVSWIPRTYLVAPSTQRPRWNQAPRPRRSTANRRHGEKDDKTSYGNER
jgi:hypothetical protein